MSTKNIFKYIVQLLFLLIAVCFVWMSINALIIHQYSQEYSEEESDVAIVLGAGTSDGALSPVFRERVNHGVYLWKE